MNNNKELFGLLPEHLKNLCHMKLCAFRSEFSKSSSWKIGSFFKKNMLLQRELLLTSIYTINLSLLFVIKKGFMIIIILSNYQ